MGGLPSRSNLSKGNRKMKSFVSVGSRSGSCLRLLQCILATAACFQLYTVEDRSFQPILALITGVHLLWNFALGIQDLYASIYGSNHTMTLTMLMGGQFVWGMSVSSISPAVALVITYSRSVPAEIWILLGLTCSSWILIALSALKSYSLVLHLLNYEKASTGTSEVGGIGTKSAADSIATGY